MIIDIYTHLAPRRSLQNERHVAALRNITNRL
jgi:hypothetical protein